MSEGIDIAGEQFGLLTALRPVDKRDGDFVWVCRCQCGNFALRKVAYLRYARKKGRESACAECNTEVKSGYFENKRRVKAEHLTGRALSGEGLWNYWEESSLTDTIRNEIAEYLGFRPNEEEDDPEDFWVDPIYFDFEPDVDGFNGGPERCVALVCDAWRDPPKVLNFIEVALDRAKVKHASNQDFMRALQTAIRYARCGGDRQKLTLEQLAVRWQCSVATVQKIVDEGLPMFSEYSRGKAEKFVNVPDADYWVTDQFGTGQKQKAVVWFDPIEPDALENVL